MSSCASCDNGDSRKMNTVPRPSNDTVSGSSGCPYRMSDGRNFTDYRTRCTIDYETKVKNAFQSSYDQRQFLIHNATKFMQENSRVAESMNACSGCFPKNAPGTMLPERNMVKCNEKFCEFNTANPNGLGTGRNYNA